MIFQLKGVRRILFIVCFMPLVAFVTPLFEVEVEAQTTERLPRILVIVSTVEPQAARAGDLWTDLFEYGIIANVSSTSAYISMDRSNYDVIIFSGYSNPIDPEDIYLNMITDVEAGRKLIFMNYKPLKQTYSNGSTLKTYYKFSIVDMPHDSPAYTSNAVRLVSNPGDDYLREGLTTTLSHMDYFATLPETAIGWVKDEISGHYFAIFTHKGGWIGQDSCTALHMGKVVAKIWWGNTNKRFGFSMNLMYGMPVFLWRVDADGSREKEPLDWLADLAVRYNFKVSVGAQGGRLTSDVIAGYWRDFATSRLVKVGVHTYTHQTPVSAQNITHEVIDTYELLASYNIPTEKFFLGWGGSDWSWQQIKTLFDYNWTVVHGSRREWPPLPQRLGVVDKYDIYTIANFTVAPALFGVTGEHDYIAYTNNLNFTEVNIERYKRSEVAHLPFILLTHDYTYHTDVYYNDYGPIKDQIEEFFEWLKSQEVYSVWITEYYDFFHDTFMAMITRSKNTFTVARPNAKANFVKILVGNNQAYAVGESVLAQRILDGWLYITLKPEKTSTFTLKAGVNPNPYVFLSTSTITSISFTNQRLSATLEGVINTTGKVKIHDSWSGNPRWVKFSNGTVINLFRQNDGVTNINVKFASDKVQLTLGRGASFYGENAIWADRGWNYTSLSYDSTSKTLMVALNSTFDMVRITDGGVSGDHAQVGSMQTVWFKTEYEYGSVDFNDTLGTLLINGKSMIWSKANSRWEHAVTSTTLCTQAFKVTSVENIYFIDCIGLGKPTFIANGYVLSFNETDGMAKIMVKGENLTVSWTEDKIDLIDTEPTVINDLVGEKSITWDKIEITGIDARISGLGVMKVRVNVTYAYANTPITAAAVTVNEIKCAETEPGTYACEIHSWNPFQSLSIEANLPNFTETTKSMSITHTMNLLLSLIIYVVIIAAWATLYYFLRRK